MPVIKRIILISFTMALCISGSLVTQARTNTEALQNIQKRLVQKDQEKQSVQKEIENIQQELESLNTYISMNQEAMTNTQTKISETNQLIEKKKEEIVNLEDNILSRKGVMKKRLLALQHDDNLNLLIKVFLEAKSLNDFIQRASAVSALFSADQNILNAQQDDLRQIEADKQEINQQEQRLKDEQQKLDRQQAGLNKNLQKRQKNLTLLQAKYSRIDQQITLAQKEKSGIEAHLKAAQVRIQKEQEQVRMRFQLEQQAARNIQSQAPTVLSPKNTSAQIGNGSDMYVTATAYSPEDSGNITLSGYNIKQNPNLKLIAVDPSVIPLGKKVWVEGYGVAVAGDTGGAITGHKIDVLMPTKQQALLWGRKTVKVVILN